MTPLHPHGARPETPSTPLLRLLGGAALLVAAAAVALTVPPRALFAMALLGLLVGAVTRVGVWVLGERTGRVATAVAIRAGAGAAGVALGVGGMAVLLGPATPDVLATAIVVTILYLATTRGGRLTGLR